MEKPTLEILDQSRKEGFRPSVIACLIHNKRVLLVFKEEYKLWQLPQGGIANKEDPDKALERELVEELGSEFTKVVDFSSVKYIGEDKMEFKPGKHNIDPMVDDSGTSIPMLGKLYYFATVDCGSDELDISKTQFDQHFWMSHQEANFLAEKIYQKGKRRITMKILENLLNLGIIE